MPKPNIVSVAIVGGPSDLDLFIHGLHDGKEVEFTLIFSWGKERRSVQIYGLGKVSDALDYWIMNGIIEISNRKWIPFEQALYSPRERKGQFNFPVKNENLEPCQLCGESIQKGAPVCSHCGAKKGDV